MEKRYKSLDEFYPYYLTEHQNAICRRLHFIGTFLVILNFIWAVSSQNWWALWFIPIIGYSFAWVGHFFFEKNKPATFQYPFYSLASDFILFKDLFIGREKFTPSSAK